MADFKMYLSPVSIHTDFIQIIWICNCGSYDLPTGGKIWWPAPNAFTQAVPPPKLMTYRVTEIIKRLHVIEFTLSRDTHFWWTSGIENESSVLKQVRDSLFLSGFEYYHLNDRVFVEGAWQFNINLFYLRLLASSEERASLGWGFFVCSVKSVHFITLSAYQNTCVVKTGGNNAPPVEID